MPRQYSRTDPQERFWAKVDKSGDCWIWQGKPNRDGYGQFAKDSSPNVAAHRFAYELMVGPIPPGLQIDHLCRVRMCVNPAHMEPVTLQENVRRGASFSARNTRCTHCPQGHEYTLENTYRRKDHPTSRDCLICRRARSLQFMRGKRAQS